jgi:hypothetical protein
MAAVAGAARRRFQAVLAAVALAVAATASEGYSAMLSSAMQ